MLGTHSYPQPDRCRMGVGQLEKGRSPWRESCGARGSGEVSEKHCELATLEEETIMAELNPQPLPPRWAEELIRSLLHNPYLGSMGGNPNPPSERTIFSPFPEPWVAAVSYLINAVNLKEVASVVKNEHLRTRLIETSNGAISRFLDDFCGTPPRLIPWPWPGPPPWIIPLASELVRYANTLQEGHLRGEMLNVAGLLMERGFAGAD